LIATPVKSLSSPKTLANPEIEHATYLYDTAGIVHDHQLCNHFNYKELTYFFPSKQMILRKIERDPGKSFFIGGFVRIDVLPQESDNCTFFLYSSIKLPVHKFRTKNINQVLNNIGTVEKHLYPPLLENRVVPFPVLEFLGTFKNQHSHERSFYISGAGWFTVEGKCVFDVYTPKKQGLFTINDNFIRMQ
jgi:hypothetical protein